MNDRGAFRETFARQAIPMVWDYAEANPFSDSGGNFSMYIDECESIAFYLLSTWCSVQQDAVTIKLIC